MADLPCELMLLVFTYLPTGNVRRPIYAHCRPKSISFVHASPECLGLLHDANCECLIVNAFEFTVDHRIFLFLHLRYTLVQIDILHTHSFPIDCHVMWNSLWCIVYHMLLINQTIHLGSGSCQFGDAMSVVLVLQNGSRQLLVEVEE